MPNHGVKHDDPTYKGRVLRFARGFTPLPRFSSLHGTVMICRSYFQVEIELQVQPHIKRLTAALQASRPAKLSAA